jgi:hypothetical protein
MKTKYKIIVGPDSMVVERFGLVSKPIEIGDEHIAKDNQTAKEFYDNHMHNICAALIKSKWVLNREKWAFLKKSAQEFFEKNPVLYFDGPDTIVSTVPWKQSKYGEWFLVSKKVKWLLKKLYSEKL